jgi:hypothetical protein
MVVMVEGVEERAIRERPETEQVHFCRTYIRPPIPRDRNDIIADYEQSRSWARIAARLFLMLFAIVIVLCFTRLFAIPTVVGISVGCILVAGMCIHWAVVPRRLERRMRREQVDELPPVGSRLQCVGAPSDLPHLGDLQSIMFEPRVYRASSASLLIMQAAASVGLALLICGSGLLDGKYGWGTVVAILGAAVFFTIHLRPLYFRISPGRLEVLRYGFIQREPMEVDEYDLRYAYIVADLHRRRLTVSHSERKGKSYSILLMRERREFLHTLFMAALSKQQAPSLPVDTL